MLNDPPRMKRTKRYDPLGMCIYCGASDGPLTDEHIIPEAIGGRLVLSGASCLACARETHAFEGHGLAQFRPWRRHLGIRSKNKGRLAKERLAKEKYILEVDGRIIKVPIEDFPPLLLTLFFDYPPGILTGAQPIDVLLTGGINNIELSPAFGIKHLKIMQKYNARSVSVVGVRPSPKDDGNSFGRTLAKIAHSYAYAEGFAFEPLLLNIIRGIKPYNLPYLIGSYGPTKEAGEDLHEICIDENHIATGHLVVKIRMFALYKCATYYVVAGRLPCAIMTDAEYTSR